MLPEGAILRNPACNVGLYNTLKIKACQRYAFSLKKNIHHIVMSYIQSIYHIVFRTYRSERQSMQNMSANSTPLLWNRLKISKTDDFWERVPLARHCRYAQLPPTLHVGLLKIAPSGSISKPLALIL